MERKRREGAREMFTVRRFSEPQALIIAAYMRVSEAARSARREEDEVQAFSAVAQAARRQVR